MTKTFDKCLEYIGSFGRYQKRRFLLLSIYGALCAGWALGLTVFLIMPPAHHCALPPPHLLPPALRDLPPSNLSRIFIPEETDVMGVLGPSKCKMRSESRVASVLLSLTPDLSSEALRDALAEGETDKDWTPCHYGWWYDPSHKWSIVPEYDLVCGRDYLGSLLMTVNSVGGIIGTFVFSILQDKLGRKPSLFIILTYYIILSFIGIFMPSIEAFIISTTLRSIAGIGLFQIPYVLCLEMVTVKESTFIVNGMSVVFSLGFAVLPLIAWLCHSELRWKALTLATTLPFVVFYAYWWLIDESPRWQLTQGRKDAAVKTMMKMVKENGVDVSEDQVREITDAVEEEEREEAKAEGVSTSPNLLDLFSNKRLVLVTLSMAFLWCVNAMVYSGIMLNTAYFGGDPYVVFAIIALSEIPAELANIFVVDRVGRIWPSAICMGVAGLSLVGTVLVPAWVERWVVISLVGLGKFAITASFCTLYQLGGELFPTVIRATGIGFATTISQVMGLTTPFIIYAGGQYPVLPMGLLGGLSLVGAGLTLLLPETLGVPLPDTIPDMARSGGIGPRSLLRNLRCQKKHPGPE